MPFAPHNIMLLCLLLQPTTSAALLGRLVGARKRRVGLVSPGIERVRSFWRKDETPRSRRLAEMIRLQPSLDRSTYTPTPWARSSKANFVLATTRSRLGALRRAVEPPLTNRVSETGDADVHVEWAKDEVGAALPADAPIVVFLHTITGSAAQTRWLTSAASERGWRSCVFVRRGHGGRLSSPSFDLLGNADDVELQLAAVRRAYPRASFLGMVGVSAGSSLLVTHLGRAGASTPVGAACAICPAWDTAYAFSQLGVTQPVAERAMVQSIKSRFVRRNARVLRAWDESAYQACMAATSLPEMLAAHAPYAMRQHGATAEEYYAAHDPMSDRRGVTVPTLLLNAEDDFVCPAALARPDVIVDEQPGALLLMTKSGSHVAFNEGAFALGEPYHLRVSFDFLEAARATAGGISKAPSAGSMQGVVVPTAALLTSKRRARQEADQARTR